MGIRPKLVQGVLWSVTARLLGLLCGFLAILLLARILPVDLLGEFYIFQSAVVLAALIGKAGLDVGLQKLLGIAIAENNNDSVINYALSAYLIACISTTFLFLSVLVAWEKISTQVLESLTLSVLAPWLCVAMVLRVFEELNSAFFRGIGESKVGVLLFDFPRLLIFVVLLTYTYLNHIEVVFTDIATFLVISGLCSTILGCGAIYVWLRSSGTNLSRKNVSAVTSSASQLSRLSLPTMLHGGAAVLMSSVDIWVIRIFGDSQDVAVYGSMARVAVMLGLALNVVNMVLPSILAGLGHQFRIREMEGLVRSAASWSAALVVPLLLVVTLFGTQIIALLFGEQFIDGYVILLLLSCAYTFNVLCGSSGALLQMTGHHNILLVVTAVWGVVNLGLNIVMIHYYGVVGVAVATLVSMIGQNITNILLCMNRLSVRTWVKIPWIGWS